MIRRLLHRLQPDRLESAAGAGAVTSNTNSSFLHQPAVIISSIGEFLLDVEAVTMARCCRHTLSSLQARYDCKRVFDIQQIAEHLASDSTLPHHSQSDSAFFSSSSSSASLRPSFHVPSSFRFGDVTNLWLYPPERENPDFIASTAAAWRHKFARLVSALISLPISIDARQYDASHIDSSAASQAVSRSNRMRKVRLKSVYFSHDWDASLLERVEWPHSVTQMRFFHQRANSNVDGSPPLNLLTITWPIKLESLELDRSWTGSIADLQLPTSLRHLRLVNPKRQTIRELHLPLSLTSLTIHLSASSRRVIEGAGGPRPGIDLGESIPAVLPLSLIHLTTGFDMPIELRWNTNWPADIRMNVKELQQLADIDTGPTMCQTSVSNRDCRIQ